MEAILTNRLWTYLGAVGIVAFSFTEAGRVSLVDIFSLPVHILKELVAYGFSDLKPH